MGCKTLQTTSTLSSLEDYLVVQTLPSFHLTYLEHTSSRQSQAVLKEFVFPSYNAAYEFYLGLEQKYCLYKMCPYLVSISKYFVGKDTEESVLVLFDHPHRTLEHEMMERGMKELRFNENELWSILVSCETALAFLEEQGIRHLNLNSSNILLSDDGVVQLYDPNILKNIPNYDRLLLNPTATKNVYPSPQLCQFLEIKNKKPQGVNPFLSDVFVMAMVIIEMALMEEMNDCYSPDYTEFYEKTLESKLERMDGMYSHSLVSVLRAMLKEPHLRCSHCRTLYLIKKGELRDSRYPIKSRPIISSQRQSALSSPPLRDVALANSKILSEQNHKDKVKERDKSNEKVELKAKKRERSASGLAGISNDISVPRIIRMEMQNV